MGYRDRYGELTNRSPLLAQILQQMQQNSQYQPQSYGALAAGLGAAYFDKKNLDKELSREQEQKQAQNQQIAQALQTFTDKSQGNPVNIPLGNLDGTTDTLQQQYMPDQQGAQSGLASALAGLGMPEQAMQVGMAQPQAPESPFAKIDPLKATPESVAEFQQGGGKDYSKLEAKPEPSSIPAELKIAEFLFPGDQAAQRKHLQKESPKDTPMQVQLAMWAADGDEEKARKLVMDGMKKADSKLSLGGVMAGIVEKMAAGTPLSPGEQKAMEWYKQNPLAALFGILGGAAQAGTKVED